MIANECGAIERSGCEEHGERDAAQSRKRLASKVPVQEVAAVVSLAGKSPSVRKQ